MVHASLRIRPIIHHFALALSLFIRPLGDSLNRAFRSPSLDGSFVGYGFRLCVVLLSTARESPRTSICARFRAFHVFVHSFFCFVLQITLSCFQICLFWNCVLLTLCVWTFLFCHLKILAEYGKCTGVAIIATPCTCVYALPPQSKSDWNKGEIIAVGCEHPGIACLPEHLQRTVPQGKLEACASIEPHLIRAR